MSVESVLVDYVIDSCLVVEDDVFAFFAHLDPQKEDVAKARGLAPCRIVHYFAAEDRWDWVDLPQLGFGACAAGFSKSGKRETLFVTSMSEVFSIHYGHSTDGFERSIPPNTIIIAKSLKFIGGHLFAAGTSSTVVRREGENEWSQVYSVSDGEKAKLFAIDGYGENDIYVTGNDRSDRQDGLLHFDGKKMTALQIPNDLIEEGFFGVGICCAPDGTVYAVDRSGALIAGNKNERWRTLVHTNDVETNYMRDMVWFKDSLYATTPDWLYRFDGTNWEPVNPETGFKPIAWGYVSANENVLLAAGPFGAATFDGEEWTSIYGQVTLEELAVKDALEKQLSAVEGVLDIFGIKKD